MIFDSKEQKQRLIDLIGEVPVQTTIKGILSGPTRELRELVNSMVNGHVVSVDDQTVLLLEMQDRDD